MEMIKFLINSECFKVFTILLLCLLKSHSVLCACSDEEWDCDDGSCIPLRQRCDGIVDCQDRSDEIAENCIHHYQSCQDVGFPCTYGACITKNHRCNHIKDCADNSDEIICESTWKKDLQGRCGERELQCLRSKECISKMLACNGYTDCIDGTDETVEVCADYICPNGKFHCGYGGCISEEARCNGTMECVDGSDEAWELCGTPRKISSIRIETTTAVQSKTTSVRQPINDDGLNCKIPNGLDALTITLLGTGEQLASGSLVYEQDTIQAKCKDSNIDEVKDLFCLRGEWQGMFPKCKVFCDKSFLSGISTTYLCQRNGIHRQAFCTPNILPNITIAVYCAAGFKRPDERTTPQQLLCTPDGKLSEKRVPCVQDCGQLTPAHPALSKNAFIIKPIDAPWHVAIFQNSDGIQKQICGGTILSPTIIITAAHCFWNKTFPTSPDLYRIIAGSPNNVYIEGNSNELVQESFVEQIYMSADYRDRQRQFYADVALLKLNTSLIYNDNVSPICMSDPEYDSKDYVFSNIVGDIAGYGTSGALERLSLKTLSNELCADLDKSRSLPTDKFCLRNENNNSTLCRGDSGGGFVVRRDNGYYLLGVVSYTSEAKLDCVTANHIVMSNVQHMRPDLRKMWQSEITKDNALF